MAFTKITNTELNSRGATTLANQPTISPQALKEEFDAPAKEVVAPKFNNLIDELEASTAAASIGAVAPTGQTGDTVQGVLNSIAEEVASIETRIPEDSADILDAIAKKHSHSNKSVLDKMSEDASGNPLYNSMMFGHKVTISTTDIGEGVALDANEIYIVVES